ncbi:hypothetical protein FF2_018947 [Malus domestica]
MRTTQEIEGLAARAEAALGVKKNKNRKQKPRGRRSEDSCLRQCEKQKHRTATEQKAALGSTREEEEHRGRGFTPFLLVLSSQTHVLLLV